MRGFRLDKSRYFLHELVHGTIDPTTVNLVHEKVSLTICTCFETDF